MERDLLVHRNGLRSRLQLLPRALGDISKYKLCLQLPLLWDTKCLGGLLVGNGVVVLKVCSKTFRFESSPEVELVHGGCVLGPLREVFGVDCVGGLQFLDRLGVFVEEDLKNINQYQTVARIDSNKLTVPKAPLNMAIRCAVFS